MDTTSLKMVGHLAARAKTVHNFSARGFKWLVGDFQGKRKEHGVLYFYNRSFAQLSFEDTNLRQHNGKDIRVTKYIANLKDSAYIYTCTFYGKSVGV